MNFKFEEVVINNVTLNIIVDEEGTKWYPFTKVLKKVLKKDEDANKYRDANLGKDMRLWPVKNPSKFISELWYINEQALIRFLKKTKVNPYTALTIKREIALHGALDYFGIERQDRDNTYTVVKPTKKEYTPWELSCFKYDPNIKIDAIWRKCDTCFRYFPYTKNYFKGEPEIKEMTTCLECNGEEFKNHNKDIQSMKDLNREELIPYILEDKPIELYLKLKKEPFPKRLDFFDNKRRILELLKYLDKKRIEEHEGGFYLSYIAEILNMNAKRLKYIINNEFEIGTMKPLPKHSQRPNLEELTEEERKARILISQERKEKRKIRRVKTDEKYKKKMRDLTAQKRRENIDNIIDVCNKSIKEKNRIPNSMMEKIYPELETVYAFTTPKKIHIVTYKLPEEYKKIVFHKIPDRNDFFNNLEKELKEAFKEYED